MNKVLSLPQNFEDFLAFIDAKYTVKWNSDEHFLYDSIVNYDKFFVTSKKRSFPNDRIDRSYWVYDIDLVKAGKYIDSHMLRPFSNNREQINSLVGIFNHKDL